MITVTYRDILNHCVEAQGARREISDACAREIAELYKSHDDDLVRAFTRIGQMPSVQGGATTLWREIFMNYEGLSPNGKIMADMLGTYLMKREREQRFSPVENWQANSL